MKCYKPLTAFKNPKGGKLFFNAPKNSVAAGFIKVQIRCGQCIGCRLNTSRLWAIRLVQEAKCHNANSFLTLTYSDEHLPEYSSLRPRDLQLFIKRLRQKLWRKYKIKVRFYAVGEYGEKTNRPHYHVLLFGYDFYEDRKLLKISKKGHHLFKSDLLSECWPFGHANLGEVTFESAAYCARYCLKKLKGKMRDNLEVACDIQTGEVLLRVDEFARMSTNPGIGRLFYEKYGDDIRRTDSVVARQKYLCIPPRYYDKLTEKFYPEIYDEIKRNRLTDKIIDDSFETAHELSKAELARELLQNSAHLKGKL